MKIQLTVHVGLVGCDRKEEIEIDDESWELMTPKERDEEMLQALFEIVDWDYKEIG